MKNEKFENRKIAYSDNGQIDSLSPNELIILQKINEQLKDKFDSVIEDESSSLKDTQRAINQVNKIITFQTRIQTILCKDHPKKDVVSYDTQTILSSSSVVKKDSKLLIDIPKGYFQTNEKK